MLFNDIKNDPNLRGYLKKVFIFLVFLFILDNLVNLVLVSGLNRYYGLGQSSEIALVGHSHLMLGVDKISLESGIHRIVTKYTREGVNVADREMMIDQLLHENPSLKLVVYDVDAWMFTGEGLSVNSYKLFYPFMSQPEIADYIQTQGSFSDFWQHYLIKSSRYNEGLISGSFRGYLDIWSNLKFGTVDTVRLKKEIVEGNYRKINSTEENRTIFERSIKKLLNKNIKVVLLYVPTIAPYNQAEPGKFENEIRYFNNLATTMPGVSYLEYLSPWSHDYSLFFDPIHMNPKGQEIITGQLVKDLKPILN